MAGAAAKNTMPLPGSASRNEEVKTGSTTMVVQPTWDEVCRDGDYARAAMIVAGIMRLVIIAAPACNTLQQSGDNACSLGRANNGAWQKHMAEATM